MKCTSNPAGYSIIGLRKNNKQFHYPLARIVAKVFISNPENKEEVNHIDGNKKNNNISNLEWVTRKENMIHASKTGLLRIKGEKRPPQKIYQLDLNGNIIKKWNSCREIVEKMKMHETRIYACCNGKNKTSRGYMWKYEDELANDGKSIN